jgi:hypothetical protein
LLSVFYQFSGITATYHRNDACPVRYIAALVRPPLLVMAAAFS